MRFNLNSNLELREELIVPPGCIRTSKALKSGIHADPLPSLLSPRRVPRSEPPNPAILLGGSRGRTGEIRCHFFSREIKKQKTKTKRLHVDSVSPFMSPEHPRVLQRAKASTQVTLWKCHQLACCGNTLGAQFSSQETGQTSPPTQERRAKIQPSSQAALPTAGIFICKHWS